MSPNAETYVLEQIQALKKGHNLMRRDLVSVKSRHRQSLRFIFSTAGMCLSLWAAARFEWPWYVTAIAFFAALLASTRVADETAGYSEAELEEPEPME